MRALVTGATGFVGNRLVLRLLRDGWDVVCLIRRNVAASEKVGCLTADLNDLPSLQLTERLAGPIDVFFHAGAALPAADLPLSHYLVANALATAALLEAAEAWKVRAFVYTSSLLVIGKPGQDPISTGQASSTLHPYALGKLCGEQVCEFFRATGRVPTTSLRMTSIFGIGMSSGSVLPKFAARALQSQDLFFDGTGQRVQNFVHVDDVVQACMLAANRPGAGVLNVGGAASINMKELAELVVKLTPGSKSRIEASGRTAPQENYRWIPDITGTEVKIGYVPEVNLEKAVSEYIESLAQPTFVERWWNGQ